MVGCVNKPQMNNTIRVSVIIPVYNVTSYLTECLTSLAHQTLTAVEFITVNDGSTDGSDLILESFAQKDSRFRVVHQSNQGVSVARNQGLLLAQGECVAFVDADDFVANDYLEQLYEAYICHSVQIVVSNYTSQVDGKWVEFRKQFINNEIYSNLQIHHEIIADFLKNDSLNTSWGKLFSRGLINSHEIFFPSGVTNGEDAFFCMKAFAVAESLMFINNSGYHYREVYGSASRNILAKNYLQIAVDTYSFDHQSYAQLILPSDLIYRYKSQRFIENLYSLIHIYMCTKEYVPWVKRVKAVYQIIQHPKLNEALQSFGNSLEKTSFGYRKMMLRFMRRKFLLGIISLTTYSNFRNNYFKSKN